MAISAGLLLGADVRSARGPAGAAEAAERGDSGAGGTFGSPRRGKNAGNIRSTMIIIWLWL